MCSGGDAGTRARALAENLIANVDEPYDLAGRRQIVAMSFGIAEAEASDEEPLAVLQRADTALYASKANGGNRLASFEPGMAAGLAKRQNLESELWEAFERRDFELYYQPQVDLSDERLTGFEALLRWHHPRLGFISPAEFVPVAEASGLIQRLGAWVLEEACATAAAWPPSIKLAVNVSPVQFARGDLVTTIAHALARSGLPAERLELEITESVLLQENHGVRRTIDAVRGMGVNFALDDFGTGYSSLTYIHKFPISKIKIDRSFVSEIPLSQEAAAIISAVAALARSLDIRRTPKASRPARSWSCCGSSAAPKVRATSSANRSRPRPPQSLSSRSARCRAPRTGLEPRSLRRLRGDGAKCSAVLRNKRRETETILPEERNNAETAEAHF